MPNYDYECPACKRGFELYHGIKDPPAKCPICDGVMTKKIGVLGFIFKGSGFYVNDSKGKR